MVSSFQQINGPICATITSRYAAIALAITTFESICFIVITINDDEIIVIKVTGYFIRNFRNLSLKAIIAIAMNSSLFNFDYYSSFLTILERQTIYDYFSYYMIDFPQSKTAFLKLEGLELKLKMDLILQKD